MIHLDLRPADEPQTGAATLGTQIRAALATPAFAAGAAMLLLPLALAWTLERRLGGREAALGRDLARAEATADSLQAARTGAARLQQEQMRLRQRREAIRQVEVDPYTLVRLLDRIATEIPAGAWVDAVLIESFSPATGAIGFRLRGYSPSADRAAEFQRRLAAAEPVRSVELDASGSVDIGGVPVVRFELYGNAGGRAAGAGYAFTNVLDLVLPDALADDEPSTAYP